MRRTKSVFSVVILGAWSLLSLSWAPHSAAAEPIIFAVSEGAESLASVSELADRYQGLSKRISLALKRPVTLLPTTRIPAMQQALAESRADLAWIRPANVIADAMVNQGYTLVVSAEGQFYSAFVVSNNSPLKTLKDLEGKRVMHPPQGAVVYKMGAAELRDQGVHATMDEQRLQEVIIFSIQNGFTDAGIVNPRQAAKFKQAGGRILHETRKFPYWALIASKKISAQEVEALRKLMLSMNDAPWGKEILALIETKSFVVQDPKGYMDLKGWIK
jgi:ABC-type phosphate/phosphonate transport system substrate-binding protein